MQIYCKHNDEDFPIVDNAMAWINGHSSYPTMKVGKDIFVVAGDLAHAEIRDLQVMAVAHGPSVNQVVMQGNGVHAIKDIHMTTGRVPLETLLVMASLSPTDGHESSVTPFMNIGADPVQPDIDLVVKTVPLPNDLFSRFREINAQALKHFLTIKDKLVSMPQQRINEYNMRQNVITQTFHKNLSDQGMKPHPEGIINGVFASSICNTMMDFLPNLDTIINTKIEAARASPVDTFGMVAALFKITGIAHTETVTADMANACLSNLAPLLSSDYSYASDMKPVIDSDKGDFIIQVVENPDGTTTTSTIRDKAGKNGIVDYQMSEDIMIPFSDIFYRNANATLSTLFSHLQPEHRMEYVKSYFKGDCEDSANFAKTQYEFMCRFCVRLCSKHHTLYSRYPQLKGPTVDAIKEKLHGVLRASPMLKQWTDDQIKNVIRQCGEFGEHIYNTKMKLVLMSAKAANVESSDIQSKSSEPRPIMGHCAAMLVRGYEDSPTHPGISSNAENRQSNYDRILTELTAPIRIESFMDRHEPGGSVSGAIINQVTAANPTEESKFYNLCTSLMAPTKATKAWVHVGKLDGVFWHIVSCIGDTIPVKGSTMGVPITTACDASDKTVQGVKINFTPEEIQETVTIAKYALPPIENMEGFFQGEISKPLETTLFAQDSIPISYVCSSYEGSAVQDWCCQNSTRYEVRVGSQIIAVQQMKKCAMDKLRTSIQNKNRVLVIRP